MTNYTTLSDQELLEMLVMEPSGGSIAEELMKEFHTLPDILLDAEEEELLSVKGIGKSRMQMIKAVNELARRLYQQPQDVPFRIRGPQDVAILMVKEMRYLKQEQLRVLVLNTKNVVLSMETVSIGTANSSLVHPREVFRPAIRKGGTSIILVHNHPSGDPTPSQEDFASTERIRDCGKLMGIELLDHIVIGGATFVSLKDIGSFIF